MSDKSPSPADEETMILPKSPAAENDKPEQKEEKKKPERKTRLIQHNRRMSITGSTSKTTKDAEEMKQQIVTFLFEMADPIAVMNVYKSAKGEKRRIMAEKDKAFEQAEKERKKQEALNKKEEARKEKEAAKQRKKEEAQKKKEEAQKKKEEARKAKEAEKEQKAKEKEEAAKAKEEAAQAKKDDGASSPSPAKLKKEGSILGVSGRFKFGRSKKDSNVIYATGYLLAKHTELVETENPLHGQEDAMVVEAADGSKIDPRSKTIQTVAVKWKRNFFVLDSDGLSEYKEEVKDLQDRQEEKLAEHEFDGDAKLEAEGGDKEFKVYAVGNKELGLRVMDPNDFQIWSKAFEKHFKMAKKRAKGLKSPKKSKESDTIKEEEPEKAGDQQEKEGTQEAAAESPEGAAESEATKEPEKEKEAEEAAST